MPNRVDIAGEYGITDGSIHLHNQDGSEKVMWDSAEWVEDPSLVYVIVNAVTTHLTEAPLDPLLTELERLLSEYELSGEASPHRALAQISAVVADYREGAIERDWPSVWPVTDEEKDACTGPCPRSHYERKA